MTIRKRLLVVVALSVLAAVIYGTARHYSEDMIHYVVEQALIQKAPEDISPAVVHRQLEAYLAVEPNTRTQKLLALSARLEKTRKCTREEWLELFHESGIRQ